MFNLLFCGVRTRAYGVLEKSIFATLFLGMFFLPQARLNAQDFLTDARYLFFDDSMADRRVGIEIEFSNISDKLIEAILSDYADATVAERYPNGEISFDSPYGQIKLKIEGQAWRYEGDKEQFERQKAVDLAYAPREIVFPPIAFKDTSFIQKVCESLRLAGAIGTTETRAVAFQVNVEMPRLQVAQKNVDRLVDLMRVMSRPEHIEQIKARLRVPTVRSEYIGEYSPGFLRKLFRRGYRPTARELFDDYFYRQSLEVMGISGAWTMPLKEAKAKLLEQPDPVLPSVVKMQRLRVSSLLLDAFSEDPLAVIIKKTRWARPAPLVEFREFNTDFDGQSAIEQTLGIVRSAEVYGNYSHDKLVAQITGIDPRDQEILRTYRSEKNIVRYALYDPKTNYLGDQNSDDVRSIWIQLHPEKPGLRPLRISGESVVFNRRNIHRTTLIGEFNPGLENAFIQQAMENKLFEMKLFEKFAPGTMPRGKSLSDILPEKEMLVLKRSLQQGGSVAIEAVEALLPKLKTEFRNGWVMKGAWDLSTEHMFISDLLNFSKLLKNYANGFERHLGKIDGSLKGVDPEAKIKALKEHAGYQGWKVLELLKNPELVFFQERVEIDSEFRVEVQGGRVLGQGSTLLRWSYEKNAKEQARDRERYRAQIAEVEQFAKKFIDQLPEAMRFIPYGLDIAMARLPGSKELRPVLIESNPGGNSSFLEENPVSLKILDQYLLRYPDLVRSRQIRTLSAKQQLSWLKEQFAAFGFDLKRLYPGFTFTDSDLMDDAYPRRKVSNKCSKKLLEP